MTCPRLQFQHHSLLVSVWIIGLLAAGAPTYADSHSHNRLQITSLSTAPQRVSGGDVLVRVSVPRRVLLSDVAVTLNGDDVTGAFLADDASHALIGLVTGLRDGRNVLTAVTSTSPSQRARLAIRNFPIYGPIFAGPHQTPWICETETSGLGPSLDEHCTVPTIYEWFYRSTDGTFKSLPTLTPPFPKDLAQTTTIDGDTVNYIVRVESGTIDQSIYRISIIDDPTNPIRDPWSRDGTRPGPGWNGKLSFPFGGGCGPGYRSGRNDATSALSDDPLSLGFAVAFGTRNTLGTGCDFVISAETMMMVKEHFIEQYGIPKFTIGSGGSGGSMQQHFIAQNYPGLLDAITPGVSYSDLVSILPDVTDCGLLNHYFDTVVNPADWPAGRRSKVDGYPVSADGMNTTCRSWDGFAHTWVSPFNGFDPVVPVELRYDPVTNPGGARGSFTDGMVNVFGIDPATGFARTVYDNVGVQYGLQSLNNGDITKTEFLDLNELIGGLDVDGNYIPARSEGNLEGIAIAYRAGVVDSGENLTLPILDTRTYTDDIIDIHTRIRTFAKLDRLRDENRTSENEVNWLVARVGTDLPSLSKMALIGNNEWLENILADTSRGRYALKVIRSKPAWLRDTCWDETGGAHAEQFSLGGPSVCNALFPINSTVRIRAGAPIAGDILKCQLKPIDYRDYAVIFSPQERARLNGIFPNGVCDWSRRGVGQQPIDGVWLDYTPGREGHQDGDEQSGETSD
jgi:hypothetical protein